MACTPSKVPVKINGFSGCLGINEGKAVNVTATTVVTNLVNIDGVSGIGAAGMNAAYAAYLGVKCMNIACPPTLVLNDNVTSVVEFLDAQATVTTDYRDSSITAFLTDAAGSTTATRVGIAKLISGCGCCSN